MVPDSCKNIQSSTDITKCQTDKATAIKNNGGVPPTTTIITDPEPAEPSPAGDTSRAMPLGGEFSVLYNQTDWARYGGHASLDYVFHGDDPYWVVSLGARGELEFDFGLGASIGTDLSFVDGEANGSFTVPSIFYRIANGPVAAEVTIQVDTNGNAYFLSGVGYRGELGGGPDVDKANVKQANQDVIEEKILGPAEEKATATLQNLTELEKMDSSTKEYREKHEGVKTSLEQLQKVQKVLAGWKPLADIPDEALNHNITEIQTRFNALKAPQPEPTTPAPSSSQAAFDALEKSLKELCQLFQEPYDDILGSISNMETVISNSDALNGTDKTLPDVLELVKMAIGQCEAIEKLPVTLADTKLSEAKALANKVKNPLLGFKAILENFLKQKSAGETAATKFEGDYGKVISGNTNWQISIPTAQKLKGDLERLKGEIEAKLKEFTAPEDQPFVARLQETLGKIVNLEQEADNVIQHINGVSDTDAEVKAVAATEKAGKAIIDSLQVIAKATLGGTKAEPDVLKQIIEAILKEKSTVTIESWLSLLGQETPKILANLAVIAPYLSQFPGNKTIQAYKEWSSSLPQSLGRIRAELIKKNTELTQEAIRTAQQIVDDLRGKLTDVKTRLGLSKDPFTDADVTEALKAYRGNIQQLRDDLTAAIAGYQTNTLPQLAGLQKTTGSTVDAYVAQAGQIIDQLSLVLKTIPASGKNDAAKIVKPALEKSLSNLLTVMSTFLQLELVAGRATGRDVSERNFDETFDVIEGVSSKDKAGLQQALADAKQQQNESKALWASVQPFEHDPNVEADVATIESRIKRIDRVVTAAEEQLKSLDRTEVAQIMQQGEDDYVGVLQTVLGLGTTDSLPQDPLRKAQTAIGKLMEDVPNKDWEATAQKAVAWNRAIQEGLTGIEELQKKLSALPDSASTRKNKEILGQHFIDLQTLSERLAEIQPGIVAKVDEFKGSAKAQVSQAYESSSNSFKGVIENISGSPLTVITLTDIDNAGLKVMSTHDSAQLKRWQQIVGSTITDLQGKQKIIDEAIVDTDDLSMRREYHEKVAGWISNLQTLKGKIERQFQPAQKKIVFDPNKAIEDAGSLLGDKFLDMDVVSHDVDSNHRGFLILYTGKSPKLFSHQLTKKLAGLEGKINIGVFSRDEAQGQKAEETLGNFLGSATPAAISPTLGDAQLYYIVARSNGDDKQSTTFVNYRQSVTKPAEMAWIMKNLFPDYKAKNEPTNNTLKLLQDIGDFLDKGGLYLNSPINRYQNDSSNLEKTLRKNFPEGAIPFFVNMDNLTASTSGNNGKLNYPKLEALFNWINQSIPDATGIFIVCYHHGENQVAYEDGKTAFQEAKNKVTIFNGVYAGRPKKIIMQPLAARQRVFGNKEHTYYQLVVVRGTTTMKDVQAKLSNLVLTKPPAD